MKLTIEGLHPVTGTWITLQQEEEKSFDELTQEEIEEGLEQYSELIKTLTKADAAVGCQMTITGPSYKIVFDPRKFLAVKVTLV